MSHSVKLPDLDEKLTLKELAACVEPRPVHYLTIYRWQQKGLRVGRRKIRLKTICVAGRKYGTRRWLNDFLAAVQVTDDARGEFLPPNQASVASQLDRELAS